MRKLPSQVPDAVSRLLQSTLIVTPPVWYQPVLTNPPPVLPSRRSRPRPSLDQSSSRSEPLPRRAKGPAYRPREIVYEEDRVRRQFFRDFPFEAMRPASLVEGREVRALNEVEGPSWTSLEQRGSYPSVEDCIAYTLNVRTHQKLPVSEAYAKAVAEFLRLRARHEMATMAAEMEARHHGASFLRDPFERAFYLQGRALDTLRASGSKDKAEASSIKFREPKRWTSIVQPNAVPNTEFAGGQNYVKRWKLPPPVEVETKQPAAPVDAIPPPKEEVVEQEEGEGDEGEEEVDDLAFLRNALRTPGRGD